MTRDDLLHDRAAVAGLVRSIVDTATRLGRPATFMEVCGTHTHAVAGAGLRRMLPAGIRLVSGPGCPVCVTPVGYLDRALALAARPGTVLCTFGDLMRVPSSTLNLEQARAQGRDVRIVYSPRDALAVARSTDRQVVFLAVGFETTTPTIAAVLAEAEASGTPNFQILPGNKLSLRPCSPSSTTPSSRSTASCCPATSRCSPAGRPSAPWPTTTAFRRRRRLRPTDILRGVLELLEQNAGGRCAIVNLYGTECFPRGTPPPPRWWSASSPRPTTAGAVSVSSPAPVSRCAPSGPTATPL